MADPKPKQPRKRASDSQRPPHSGAIDVGVQRSAATHDEQGRVVGSGIRTVKTQHDQNWVKTRDKARQCRTLMAGELGMVMPKNFQLANADAFAADLPTTYTRPAELLALLLQKRCELERYRTTGSARSNDTATTLEQIISSVMTDPAPEKGWPWFQVCDTVQNDSLCCVISQPMPTFWESEERPHWQDAESGTFKPEYQRDKAGRARRQVEKGFRVNGAASKAAYQEALDDWIAAHPPIMYRAFGPQDVTPILGPNFRVDAVIVSGRYQRTSEMAMRFAWGEGDHLSPAGVEYGGTTSGAYGDVEILEYWGFSYDAATKRRCPYVSYCVDGMATAFRDSNDPAVIDLSPYCSRLPVAVRWGGHWPGAPKVDQRALPFMWPFLQSIRQANAIATGICVALWWAGFPTYTVDRSASTLPVNPNAQPRVTTIEPLKVIETDGPVTRLQGGEVSRDATMLLQLLLGENEKAAPPSQASGKGNSSGFEKTIARAYAEDAQFMILEGIRQLYEESASFTLEILTNVARDKEMPVLVDYAGPVVTPASARVTSTRSRLELTPDLAGNVWAMRADYPASMSLAERQQSAELVKERLKTKRKHFEDDGIADPERYAAEIEAEDLVNSPIGQAQRWDLIAKILGDDQMAERIKLMEQEQISQGPNGTGGLPFSLAMGFEDILTQRAAAEAAGGVPMAAPAAGGPQGPPPGAPPGAGAGMPPAVQPGVPDGGQHLTGMGGSSTAQSSLAGTIGGQMSAGPIAQAAAAGGAVPPDLNTGGG